MASEVAPSFFHQPFPVRGNPSSKLSMAALMQSNNDPASVSIPLSGPSSNSVVNSNNPTDSVILFKQPNPEASLSSIASAGLHVSRSRDSLSQMNPARTVGFVDRPPNHDQDSSSQQRNSQVAREALGASEKSHSNSSGKSTTNPMNHDTPMHMPPSDHIPIDPQTGAGNVTDAFAVTENHAHPSSLITSSTVASPGPIEDSMSQDGDRSQHNNRDDGGGIPQEGTSSNKAFSYPMPTPSIGDARRGLSLPNTGFHRGSLRSPSAKKHRCPYCTTEFTRHHNLKSHLLTHSQEKPYVCQTCQSRFRRLHDLKRHTKLHTGERPHICPKCGRRFARGDALARHNKGQGGCAGRRASMGSFVPEDEYGDGTAPPGADDTMDGLVYAEPERMDEDDERRRNMPSIKRHDAPPGHFHRSSPATTTIFQPRQTNTYPPIAAAAAASRPSAGGLFPPAGGHGASSSSTSPISQTGNFTFPPPGQQPSGGASSVFQPSNVTESPKPLSPNSLSSHQLGHGPENNNMQLHPSHSPGGMVQSYQQQPAFGRSQASVANHNPGLGLPPPQPGAPQLPPPPGLNSSDSRFALHSQAVPVQPPSSGPPKQTSSHSLSRNHAIPTHSTTVEASQNNPNFFSTFQDPGFADHGREDQLWAYIRTVHEEMTGLKTEVAALRAQIASSNFSAAVNNNSHSQTDAGQR